MNKFDLNLRINDLSFDGDQSKLVDLIDPMIDELAEKMGIPQEAIKLSINNIHTLGENKKVKKEKINLVNIEEVTIYSKKHMQTMPKEYINWTSLSRDFVLAESVIRKFHNKLDWHWIVLRMDEGHYDFSKHFIEEFNDVIAQTRIDIKNHPDIYDDTWILDPPKPENRNGRIYPPEIIQDKLRNLYLDGNNGHPGDVGLPPGIIIGRWNDMMYPMGPDYDEKLEEEYLDTKNMIITPENFQDIFSAPFITLSRDMIDDLCSNYKLSKEFVFKYERNLNFRSLMTNDYFNTLMKDGEFFDRYIDKFVKLKQISHMKEGTLKGYLIKKPKIG